MEDFCDCDQRGEREVEGGGRLAADRSHLPAAEARDERRGIQERVFLRSSSNVCYITKIPELAARLACWPKKGAHGGISSSIPAQGKNNCTRVKGEWECVSSHSKKELAARMAASGGDMAFMTRAVYLPARAR